MIDLFISIFGYYEPLTDSNGIPLQGLASINWEYLGTVAMFFCFLTFILRIMTIFFKGVMNVK